MFTLMRQTLGIPKPTDILTHLHSLSLSPPAPPTLPSPLNHRPAAHLAIQSIERSAMATQTPQPGLLELMTFLERRKVKKGLCTRNFPAPVMHLWGKFMPGVEFEPVVTRETAGIKPKPSPEGVWWCAGSWGAAEERERAPSASASASASTSTIAGTEGKALAASIDNDSHGFDRLELASRHLGRGIIMVGDSLDDMAAGYRAGAATILLASEETEEELLTGHEYVDLVVWRLDEIIEVLEGGFVGRS